MISLIDLLQFLALGGGDPGEVNALDVEAQRVEQFAEQNPAPAGVVVAGRVVAIAGMAAGDQHRVRADLEGLDEQVEIDAAGAGQPDDAHVGRILQAGGARQVGAQVGAPVAHVGDDFRLEFAGRLRSCQALHHRVDLLLGEAFQVGALRGANGHAGAAAHAQPGIHPRRVLDEDCPAASRTSARSMA